MKFQLKNPSQFSNEKREIEHPGETIIWSNLTASDCGNSVTSYEIHSLIEQFFKSKKFWFETLNEEIKSVVFLNSELENWEKQAH